MVVLLVATNTITKTKIATPEIVRVNIRGSAISRDLRVDDFK
jgi:hypothetical protein